MLHFLIYDVLGTPAILVGLFSLIGLLLQKKGISDVISGTLKTIMGFVILTAGAGIIAYTLTIFSQLFEHSFHIQGWCLTPTRWPRWRRRIMARKPPQSWCWAC